MKPALEMQKGNNGGKDACVPYAAMPSCLQASDAVGSDLSRDGYYTRLEELLRMVTLAASCCETQDTPFCLTLRRHVSSDAESNLPHS